MTGVDEIVAFLRVQLDVDEQAAGMVDQLVNLAEPSENTDGMVLMSPEQYVNAAGVLSGDRIRAEVRAKRQRIDWLLSQQHDMPEGFPTYDSCRITAKPGDLGDLEVGYCSCGLDAMRTKLFRFEVQPYAGRPGFRPEWAVTN